MTHENEIEVREGDILVSMTDVKGKIVYANDLFCKTAGFTREELLGKAHNIVRHPDMPKTIFKVLWDAVLDGKPVSAFVKNSVHGGGYYWVRAFVMPVLKNGKISHIISYRRRISNSQKKVLEELYRTLFEYEKTHNLEESYTFFMNFLDERKLTYQQFLNRLSQEKQVLNAQALQIDMSQIKTDHILFKMRIENRVKSGEKNFEVTKSCCCNVGKWIESMSNSALSRIPDWNRFVSHHSNYHNNLQKFANGDISIMSQVLSDELKIYESLQTVIDTTK